MQTIRTLPKHDDEALIDDSFPKLRTIKYSGNKTRLLRAIVWLTRHVVKKGGTILDLMAGTHCVGYALKQQFRIFANDVQAYSFIIGKAFIENGGYSIDTEIAKKELMENINKNQETGEFNLFQKSYANTYFTTAQCMEIDNIRAAIETVQSPKRELYLALLMSAMCYTSNTTGHFAEFLNKPPKNPKSVQEKFFQRCKTFSVAPNGYENRVFNHEYKRFFSETDQELADIVKASDLIYLDPPYSSAQYSRFYHILETLVKYDYPIVAHKGRYRTDRYFSDFCRKSKAKSELDFALRKCSELNRNFLLLSYVDSKSCLIPKENLEEIVNSHFHHATKALIFQISHSKLGNGFSRKVDEYLILATNSQQGKTMVDKLKHYSPL